MRSSFARYVAVAAVALTAAGAIADAQLAKAEHERGQEHTTTSYLTERY